jgi:hypothetical protein
MVHGTVLDPAGLKPVYNAIVYVPTTTLDPIATGPTCEPCGKPPSGAPAAVGLSGPDGTFTLHGVPPGASVPIVVQIGKWRRENALIASVAACGNTAVDTQLTRLPKNKGEGHLPHIAISTGLDSMECALQTMGVDPSEFTPSSGPGSIHIYQGSTSYGATAGTGTAVAGTLWTNMSLLQQYDMVIDACQGVAPTDKPQQSLTNINTYAAQGGRVYLSHYESFVVWPTAETSAWSSVATQDTAAPGGTSATNVAIDLGFPKGGALAHWAMTAGASTTLGTITTIGNSRDDVLGVNAPTKSWLSGTDGLTTTPHVFQMSFYAGGQSCGKVAYSDFHVSAGPTGVAQFPAECPTAMPDPTGTSLFEFFLLDTMSCAQDDSKLPVAPPLK